MQKTQDPWVRKILWGRKWQPTPVFLPGEFHGQRSLAYCSPWGCRESDTAEQLNSKSSIYLFIYLAALGLVAVHRTFTASSRSSLAVHGLSSWGYGLSSPTRDQTYIPCIAKWTLNHWTTSEVPKPTLLLITNPPTAKGVS